MSYARYAHRLPVALLTSLALLNVLAPRSSRRP